MSTAPRPVPDSTDKPVIWTVSVSRRSDLFRDITLEYDHLASIEPLHLGFDEAARSLREQVDWSRVARETADNDFAAALLFLLDRLDIT